MRTGRLLVAVLGLLSAPHLVSAATRADGRPWWDEKRRAYPQCNAMTDEHERLTDELERLWDVAKQSVEPQRAASVRQINATAKDRLPSEAFFSEPTSELLAGMGETQGKLVQGKLVWIDGHAQNHYLTRDAQRALSSASTTPT
jgi:hypothetical protein